MQENEDDQDLDETPQNINNEIFVDQLLNERNK
jgi:hypothetical protein